MRRPSTDDEPNLGPIFSQDYGPFMPLGDKEVVWPSKDEVDDEEDNEGALRQMLDFYVILTFVVMFIPVNVHLIFIYRIC